MSTVTEGPGLFFLLVWTCFYAGYLTSTILNMRPSSSSEYLGCTRNLICVCTGVDMCAHLSFIPASLVPRSSQMQVEASPEGCAGLCCGPLWQSGKAQGLLEIMEVSPQVTTMGIPCVFIWCSSLITFCMSKVHNFACINKINIRPRNHKANQVASSFHPLWVVYVDV